MFDLLGCVLSAGMVGKAGCTRSTMRCSEKKIVDPNIRLSLWWFYHFQIDGSYQGTLTIVNYDPFVMILTFAYNWGPSDLPGVPVPAYFLCSVPVSSTASSSPVFD